MTCTACKTTKSYKVSSYLSSLAYKMGLTQNENIEEASEALLNWGVIDQDDKALFEEELNYKFLNKTIAKVLLEESSDEPLKKRGLIRNGINDADLISEDKAQDIIDAIVEEINNQEFDSEAEYELNNYQDIEDYVYKDKTLKTNTKLNIGDIVYIEPENKYMKVVSINEDTYELVDAEFSEIYKNIKFSDSYEMDFSDAIDIPGGEVEDDSSMYINNTRQLLSSSNNKRRTFSEQGYRVSYSIRRSGINARVSKNVNGVNVFFDFTLSNIKPSYKWDFEDNNVNDSYFKVSYKTVEELGVSVGKYEKYYLDFKNVDSSNFLSLAKSVIKEKEGNDEGEVTIKVCEVKTPIPNVPTAYLNIDVLIKLYTTGKAEIVLTNEHLSGFEVRNGTLRLINDHEHDVDFKLGGSARSCLGLNFNLECADYRLADIEADAGIRAALSTTLHIYDSEGNKTSVATDICYSSLDEVASQNENVKVCGDISFNWVLDIYVNTSKTMLYKYGISDKFSILDSSNQVFGNMTHIEDWQFVKSCTRKNKTKSLTSSTSTNSDKLLLEKYNVVVDKGETYTIPIKSIPTGYSESDLIYSSSNDEVASVESGTVYAIQTGSSEIKIQTKDGKYAVSLNILVSSK